MATVQETSDITTVGVTTVANLLVPEVTEDSTVSPSINETTDDLLRKLEADVGERSKASNYLGQGAGRCS